MSLNQDLVRSRCQEITDSLARLERIAKISKADFLSDQDVQDIACYRLLVAIEASLSLCYHIAARKLHKIPDEYAQCFEILGENNIIQAALCTRLRNMARFRNLLVHMYYKIENEQVYDILSNSLADLREFCARVVKIL